MKSIFQLIAIFFSILWLTDSFERVANWDRDWNDVVEMIKQWASYLWYRFGLWGAILFAGVVIVVLWTLEATRPLMNLIISGLIRAFTMFIGALTFLGITKFFHVLFKTLLTQGKRLIWYLFGLK